MATKTPLKRILEAILETKERNKSRKGTLETH